MPSAMYDPTFAKPHLDSRFLSKQTGPLLDSGCAFFASVMLWGKVFRGTTLAANKSVSAAFTRINQPQSHLLGLTPVSNTGKQPLHTVMACVMIAIECIAINREVQHDRH